MKNGLIAALVVLLVCVSISSVQAYTNEKHNFSIDPPSGWTVDDTVTFAVVMFYGPIEQEGGVTYIMNVNIQVESLPSTMTLGEYVSVGKARLPIVLGNFEIVDEGTRVINGVDAYEMVFTFTQAGIDLKGKQVTLVEAKKAYVITYGSLPTTYQKYLPAFEASVETFRILEPEPTLWYIQYWYVWVVIIAVAVAAPLAFYLIRRRAKAVPPPTAPAPPAPPPAETPPTTSAVANSRLPAKS